MTIASQPIRVVHLITGLHTGGAEMMLYKLLSAKGLSGIRHEVVSMTGPGALGERIAALGVPVHDLGMSAGVPSPAGFLRLVGILRATRPHVLQTWLYHADLLGTVAGRVVGVPSLLWNVRCSEMEERTRIRHPIFWLVRLLARWSKRPAAVLVNSSSGRVMHERVGYRPREWVMVPNGFDLDVFRPVPDAGRHLRERLGIAPEAPVIGLVARVHPMKDHATFLHAAALLRSRRTDVHFVLLGDGATGANPELSRLVKSLDLSRSVHLLGRSADVAALVPGFTLASLSSAYGEGFPNVIGEAMACGVPCVVTDVGDSRAVLGDTGTVVEPRDPQALAAGWERLLALPPEERARLGERARERVGTHFSLEAIADRYAALYQRFAAAEAAR